MVGLFVLPKSFGGQVDLNDCLLELGT